MSELKAKIDPSGALFLGADQSGNPITLHTERHAITIAGSQSGKGVGVIVPNLLRWPHNALVIDPKGEAASLTAKARTDAGLPSYVFAPFGKVSVPDELRVTINPLDRIDINSPTVREDIGVIADGIVRRMDTSKDATYWDGGARTIIAGLIAYVLLYLPDDEQNLLSVRRLLRDEDLLDLAVDEMKGEERLGGLCQATVNRVKAKEGNYFLSSAQAQTEWIDSEGFQKSLARTNFNLDDLKWGKASLYLVLPAKYLKEHGNFLRLFVRTAIDVMQDERDGKIRGNDCLFFLDEMHTLGRIDEVAESAGLMAGFGLKLWPIFQNVGQIKTLYGEEGVGTFLGSSDLHQFFGNMDGETLGLISQKAGNYNSNDMRPRPALDTSRSSKIVDDVRRQREKGWGYNPHAAQGALMAAKTQQTYEIQVHDELLKNWQEETSRLLGKPRLPPDVISKLIQKPPKGPSLNSICFVHGGTMIMPRLWPYYIDKMSNLTPPPAPVQSAPQPTRQTASGGGFWKWLFG